MVVNRHPGVCSCGTTTAGCVCHGGDACAGTHAGSAAVRQSSVSLGEPGDIVLGCWFPWGALCRSLVSAGRTWCFGADLGVDHVPRGDWCCAGYPDRSTTLSPYWTPSSHDWWPVRRGD